MSCPLFMCLCKVLYTLEVLPIQWMIVSDNQTNPQKPELIVIIAWKLWEKWVIYEITIIWLDTASNNKHLAPSKLENNSLLPPSLKDGDPGRIDHVAKTFHGWLTLKTTPVILWAQEAGPRGTGRLSCMTSSGGCPCPSPRTKCSRWTDSKKPKTSLRTLLNEAVAWGHGFFLCPFLLWVVTS